MPFNPKKEITPDQAVFLKDNYQILPLADLAKHLNVSISKVHSWKRELNLACGFRNLKKDHEVHNEYYFSWGTAKQLDFILNNC